MAHKLVFCSILTIIAMCTLTHSEVIESDAPKDSVIDATNEAPYSAVGKDEEEATESVTSQATTPEPVKKYGCRQYGYCQGTLFPYEVTVEGQGWEKTFFCQQGVNPLQHCCLPVTQHFVCYNITVKNEGKLSLGDGSQKQETDFTALCRGMLKTQNHTLGRYSFVSKAQGEADIVYRHDSWWKVDAPDSYIIQDIACEYYVEGDDDDDVESDVSVTTESPEEEEEEEEEEDEDEDEDEREKKEREKEEGESEGGGGDGGGGGARKEEAEEEDEDEGKKQGEEERKEDEEEEEEELPRKRKGKKKGRGRG